MEEGEGGPEAGGRSSTLGAMSWATGVYDWLGCRSRSQLLVTFCWSPGACTSGTSDLFGGVTGVVAVAQDKGQGTTRPEKHFGKARSQDTLLTLLYKVRQLALLRILEPKTCRRERRQ